MPSTPAQGPDFPKSRPIVICDYDTRWPVEFAVIGRRIRALVGSAALRIDHIGSTAVPGLGAKDVIDVQITVQSLAAAESVIRPLGAAGFQGHEDIVCDEFRNMPSTDPELQKRYMREPDGERRMHIHIRELSRFNQRYALLFRDYLRASEPVRVEYEILKRRAAQLFPESIDGYLFLKDPVFHIIYEAASMWAEKVDWRPDDHFL